MNNIDLNNNNKEIKNMSNFLGLNKGVFILLILVLVWVAVVAVFYYKQIITFFFPPGAPSHSLVLYTQSGDYVYDMGDTVPVQLGVNTQNTTIYAVRAIIKYNPSIYSITASDIDFSESDFYTSDCYDAATSPDGVCFVEKYANNGEIRIAVGMPNGISNSSAQNPLLVATLNFTALQPASGTQAALAFGSTTATPTGSSEIIAAASGGIQCLTPPEGVDCQATYPNPACKCDGAVNIISASNIGIGNIVIGGTLHDVDVNNDTVVDFNDFSRFMFEFPNEDSACTSNCIADINKDNVVNFTDFSLFMFGFPSQSN